MLDIGWSEMLIVGVVALIVVGPKDLPKMFHKVGQFTGKARAMAREFQRAMDIAAKEAGVDGLAKDFRKVASGRALKEAIGFDEIDREFRTIGRDLNDAGNLGKGVKPKVTPNAPAKVTPVAEPADDYDETSADEQDVQEFDAKERDSDLATRNAAVSAVEQERLKRARKIAAARQQAAEIRARKEAAQTDDVQTDTLQTDAVNPAEPAASPPSPAPRKAAKTATPRKAATAKPATAKKTTTKAAAKKAPAPKTAKAPTPPISEQTENSPPAQSGEAS